MLNNVPNAKKTTQNKIMPLTKSQSEYVTTEVEEAWIAQVDVAPEVTQVQSMN